MFWATSPPYDLMADPYDVDIQHGARDTEGLDVMPFPPERIVPMCSPDLAYGSPADPRARGSRRAYPDPFRPMLRPLAGLAGASSRAIARSRPGTAFRPVVHVDRDRRRRPRGLSRQHPARQERAGQRAAGQAARRRRPGDPGASTGLPAGKEGPAESRRLPRLAESGALRVSERTGDGSTQPGEIHHVAFRHIIRMEAQCRNASAFWFRHSQSFARRRHRLSQPMVLSTIQRFGRTTNFPASDRLTISTLICRQARLDRFAPARRRRTSHALSLPRMDAAR